MRKVRLVAFVAAAILAANYALRNDTPAPEIVVAEVPIVPESVVAPVEESPVLEAETTPTSEIVPDVLPIEKKIESEPEKSVAVTSEPKPKQNLIKKSKKKKTVVITSKTSKSKSKTFKQTIKKKSKKHKKVLYNKSANDIFLENLQRAMGNV